MISCETRATPSPFLGAGVSDDKNQGRENRVPTTADYIFGQLKEEKRNVFVCEVAIRGNAKPGQPWKLDRLEFSATSMREATAQRRGHIARLEKSGNVCKVTRLRSEILSRVHP